MCKYNKYKNEFVSETVSLDSQPYIINHTNHSGTCGNGQLTMAPKRTGASPKTRPKAKAGLETYFGRKTSEPVIGKKRSHESCSQDNPASQGTDRKAKARKESVEATNSSNRKTSRTDQKMNRPAAVKSKSKPAADKKLEQTPDESDEAVTRAVSDSAKKNQKMRSPSAHREASGTPFEYLECQNSLVAEGLDCTNAMAAMTEPALNTTNDSDTTSLSLCTTLPAAPSPSPSPAHAADTAMVSEASGHPKENLEHCKEDVACDATHATTTVPATPTPTATVSSATAAATAATPADEADEDAYVEDERQPCENETETVTDTVSLTCECGTALRGENHGKTTATPLSSFVSSLDSSDSSAVSPAPTPTLLDFDERQRILKKMLKWPFLVIDIVCRFVTHPMHLSAGMNKTDLINIACDVRQYVNSRVNSHFGQSKQHNGGGSNRDVDVVEVDVDVDPDVDSCTDRQRYCQKLYDHMEATSMSTCFSEIDTPATSYMGLAWAVCKESGFDCDAMPLPRNIFAVERFSKSIDQLKIHPHTPEHLFDDVEVFWTTRLQNLLSSQHTLSETFIEQVITPAVLTGKAATDTAYCRKCQKQCKARWFLTD